MLLAEMAPCFDIGFQKVSTFWHA